MTDSHVKLDTDKLAKCLGKNMITTPLSVNGKRKLEDGSILFDITVVSKIFNFVFYHTQWYIYQMNEW